MSAPYQRAPHRPLTDPVLLMALEGWIDAGMAASTSVATLLAELDTESVATFDADELLDHRARRPVLHLVAGVAESLSWPSIEVLAARDLDGRDLLILAGPEPDHSWKAFGHAVVGLAAELGVTQVVGLGAYPATVPHTRPVRLSITAGTEELAARWPYLRGTLDVPAGAQAVVERFATDRGLEALTLWAQIPHYASAWPYPAGSTALLENLEQVTGLRLPRGEPGAGRGRDHRAPRHHHRPQRRAHGHAPRPRGRRRRGAQRGRDPLRRRAGRRAGALPPRPGRHLSGRAPPVEEPRPVTEPRPEADR